MRKAALFLGVLSALVCAGFFVTMTKTGKAEENGDKDDSRNFKLIYFFTHAEDDFALKASGDGSFIQDCPKAGCCVQVLNSLGEKRAELLAKWFRDRAISEKITHVFASNKVRTLQTVEQIAFDAGLGGDQDGDGTLDGADVDLVPGDGVQQLPPDKDECGTGFENSAKSKEPMIAALKALPLGTVAVACVHRGTIYPILNSFGIDTTDPATFPKESDGKAKGFNNLWVVKVSPGNLGELKKHLLLDFALLPQRGASTP